MDLFSLTVILASGVLGSIVMTVCGFGLGGVVMAIWPYLMLYSQSVAISGLCGLTTALIVVFTNFKYISFKKLLPCLAAGLVDAGIAVVLSVCAAEKIMTRSLGAALLALSCYSIFLGGRIHIRATPLNGMIAGTLGGILSGLFSVGGPPIAIYMLSAADSNDEYRATLNAHFCGITIFATFMRYKSGIVTVDTIKIWMIILAALALGYYIGNKIFHKLDADKLRKIVYAYLALSGLTMLFS